MFCTGFLPEVAHLMVPGGDAGKRYKTFADCYRMADAAVRGS